MLIVFIGWAVFGQSYSWLLLLGIGVVLTGAFLIQRSSGSKGNLIAQPAVLGLALIAMVGNGLYSLVDSFAM